MAVILLVCLTVLGMGVFLKKYAEDGSDWALYFYRSNAGITGTVTDRNGETLATFSPSGNSYADDRAVRMSCFQVLGDFEGRTGSGILTTFFNGMKDYDFVNGTTGAEDYDMRVTLDSAVSAAALRAIGTSRKGCVIVSNYKTGEILCMVSMPTIDPSETGVEPEDGAFLNKCIDATFVPGSVFKLVTCAAAIESVPDIFEKEFFCEKTTTVSGVEINCVDPHWTQNFTQALSNSCNCAFARISIMAGQESLKAHVSDYGFTVCHTVSGLKTAAGTFETEYMGDPELAWAGIGQWTDSICPFSLLRYVAAIANDGVCAEPFLIYTEEEAEETQLVNPDTAAKLKEMMSYTVTEHYGKDTFSGLNVCAKTGTAEVGDGTNHAWIAGFIDDDSTPYAFVVLIEGVEDGQYGLGTAGPVADLVLQAAVENKEA